MSLSSIPSDKPFQPQPLRDRPPAAKEPETVSAAWNMGPAHDVQLTGEIAPSQLNRILTERVLNRVELELAPPARKLFETAGKAEFERDFAAASEDASPEAVAGRIAEGVAGYVFGAFQTQHPEMTQADFQDFREHVFRGLERGVEDAKDILTGLRVMTPEMEDAINRTQSLAREQLDSFSEETFAALAKR